LKNLFGSWTSSGSGYTDISGNFSFEGTDGNYELTISADGYKTTKQVVQVSKGKNNAFTLTLETQLVEPFIEKIARMVVIAAVIGVAVAALYFGLRRLRSR